MGWLSDRFDVWLLALSCLVGMCSATFIIWGVLAFSLPGILAYGVAYGGAAGGWTSLWYAFVNPIASKWIHLFREHFDLTAIIVYVRG